MERKKITFDSFIRGSIGCVIGGRDTNACGTAQRSVITFLYSLADRLHGLPVSQVFPV